MKAVVNELTPEQCRAARGLLEWSQAELADHSGVGEQSIRFFEQGKRAMQPVNIAKIVKALTRANVVLIPENGGGPGVRLRKPHRKSQATK